MEYILKLTIDEYGSEWTVDVYSYTYDENGIRSSKNGQ